VRFVLLALLALYGVVVITVAWHLGARAIRAPWLDSSRPPEELQRMRRAARWALVCLCAFGLAVGGAVVLVAR
jgi:hypothetical protein